MIRKTPKTRLDYAGVIERLRRERGMTREALAEASGVSASYLSEVERGFKRPSTDVLAKIAQALGMAPSQLLAVVENFSARPDSEETARQLPSVPAMSNLAQSFMLLERPLVRPAPSVEPPSTRKSWREAGAAEQLRPQELEDPKEQLIEALIAQSDRLDAEDLKVLVELARRLAEKRR